MQMRTQLMRVSTENIQIKKERNMAMALIQKLDPLFPLVYRLLSTFATYTSHD